MKSNIKEYTCLSIFCIAITKYPNLGNLQRRDLFWLTVLETKKSKLRSSYMARRSCPAITRQMALHGRRVCMTVASSACKGGGTGRTESSYNNLHSWKEEKSANPFWGWCSHDLITSHWVPLLKGLPPLNTTTPL